MLVASAAVHQKRSAPTVAMCADSKAMGDLTICVLRGMSAANLPRVPALRTL
jgi:hypothetical protein